MCDLGCIETKAGLLLRCTDNEMNRKSITGGIAGFCQLYHKNIIAFATETLNAWYIYPHLPLKLSQMYAKCRHILKKPNIKRDPKCHFTTNQWLLELSYKSCQDSGRIWGCSMDSLENAVLVWDQNMFCSTEPPNVKLWGKNLYRHLHPYLTVTCKRSEIAALVRNQRQTLGQIN